MIEISIFPNPVVDQINITTAQSANVEIFNMAGQKVYSGSFTDEHFTIPTRNFQTETYLVRVSSENGVSIQKVIIK